LPSDARTQKIKIILENHQGKNNQISAGEIGRQIGIDEDATHVQVRGLILQAIEQFKLPVAGGSRGYYLISNKKELDDYFRGIDGRIQEMEKRKALVRDAFGSYY
jgi:hypothetical protein